MQERLDGQPLIEKEVSLPDLIIFDLDGTVVDEPEFYRSVYSGTLNAAVLEAKGAYGLGVLDSYRRNFGGKGELALKALGIPFKNWSDKLVVAPVDLIKPQPELVEQIRALNTKKVIFTGSPIELANRILVRLGFDPAADFDAVLGWQEPEEIPQKWFCSPEIFKAICKQFNCDPSSTWSVGDNWETDLEPAALVGINPIQIRTSSGNPSRRFPNLSEFLSSFKKDNKVDSKGGD